jgi:RNA polymerase sigma factor (sigma-70 family)
MNEDELVRQAQADDRQAFWSLIEPYCERLLAYMRSQVRNRAEADDLAQETILAVLQSIGTLRERGRFCSWLWGIARHKLQDWCRDLGNRDTPLTDLLRTSEASMDDLDRPFLGPEDLGAQVLDPWDEVDHLPVNYATVLRLRYAAGLSHQQMADWLEVPASTINRYLREARQLLGERLRAREDLE